MPSIGHEYILKIKFVWLKLRKYLSIRLDNDNTNEWNKTNESGVGSVLNGVFVSEIKI